MGELVKMARKRGSKLTIEEIQQFARNLEDGKGWNGRVHKQIGLFNSGVRAHVLPPPSVKMTDDQHIARGRRMAQSPHFRQFILGTSGVLTVMNLFGETNAIADEIQDPNSEIWMAIREIEKGNMMTEPGRGPGAQKLPVRRQPGRRSPRGDFVLAGQQRQGEWC